MARDDADGTVGHGVVDDRRRVPVAHARRCDDGIARFFGGLMRGPLELLRRMAGILDDIGVEYAVGGSFASSALGEPRMSMDLDLALRLDVVQLEDLMAMVEAEFYVPREAAHRAVAHPDGMSSSFNMTDLRGPMKVDVFVLGDGLLDERQIRRRTTVLIDDVTVWVTAPAEIVLRKLLWRSVEGNDSGKQWRDVVGVLSVNFDTIDLDDLRSTAAELGVADLLDEALRQAVD